MSDLASWGVAAVTVAMLALYELGMLRAQRRHPRELARTAHAELRAQWFAAMSAMPGSETLGVQTLRNSLMSTTMTASTAVLGLMGTVTLSAPSLHARLVDAPADTPLFTVRVTLQLLLIALLFASLVAATMAVRYYNHASFIAAMPVGSPGRLQWTDTGVAYVRRAGVLYSIAVRQLILVAPILASLLQPLAGPVAAVGVILVLRNFDRAGPG